MGMMKCEYCDSPISTMAHKCPNCGGVVHAKKESVTQVNTDTNIQQQETKSDVKDFFGKIRKILFKIIKYFMITIITMTIVSLILSIVLIVKMQ